MIVTLKDAINEKIVSLPESARQRFRKAIVPIYGATDNGRATALGSALRIKINKIPYLVTAAHLIDHISYTSLNMPSEGKLLPVEGDFFTTTKPDNSRTNDKFDFAFSKISPEIAEKFTDDSFIHEEKICDTPMKEGHLYTALGYPCSTNEKTILHYEQKIIPKIATYSGTALKDGLEKLNKNQNINNKEHIIIKHNKKSLDTKFRKVNSYDPHGFSGGGLFDLGNVASIEVMVNDKIPEPKLVGLLIEHHPKHQAMVATRFDTIIAAIKERQTND